MMQGTSERTLALDPPVRGEWAIFNPPGHPRLAFDLVAVDEGKSPYQGAGLLRHLFSRIPVTATRAWNKPVFAVMDGTVVAAGDGVADREDLCMAADLFRLMFSRPGPASPFSARAGNYVILKCGDVYPVYAHLKKDTVRVRPGDAVRRGEQLGNVGNSGASLQPHLHFQVMSTPDPLPLFGNLVAFTVSSVCRRRAGRWVATDRLELASGDHLLF